MYVNFFFQAEDGIRDKLVTGVQTCALPISQHELVGRHALPHERDLVRELVEQRACRIFVGNLELARLCEDVANQLPRHVRSEERRVGKECRSRWVTYD